MKLWASLIGVLLLFAAVFAFWGGVIYVAYHFIVKFW